MRQVVMIGGLLLLVSGCALRAPLPPLANPIKVPALNRDFVWDQIVDVADNYFDIDREERPRQIGDVITAGRLDTFPTVGTTLLEPWRTDSANFPERLLCTLQSYRRRAVIQVLPAPDGYLIDVTVFKELEDLVRPEFAPTAAATFRYDQSNAGIAEPVGGQPVPLNWIREGRDCALEQRMIAQIMDRLAPPPSSPASWSYYSAKIFPHSTPPQP
jgi:hypothetical protein